ncbi:MAG: GDP-mannose 4,6-dehydratase [Candidatus Aegiribacteria sp.]
MPGTERYDYLVTGGAGFIGSHLCELLLSRGASVLALDDLSTGSLSNIQECSGSDDFQFMMGSVLDEVLTREIVARSRRVIHLAAAVGVENIIRQPVETIETNVKGTETVLMAAQAGGTPVFIASTSEIYGKSEDVPFREDGDIVLGATERSRWSYACSKAVDEFLALAYWKDKGLPVVIGRLFNTVGPRQSGRYGMVLPRFIEQALTGQPVTVFGDGTQTRCFSLVYEIVEAIADLTVNPDAIGRVINIGSTQEISILDLARRVREISGSRSEIKLIPYDEAYPTDFEDMRRRVPDVSLLRSLTGRVPEAGINTIIREILGR